jgi:hypothetical protein
VDIIEGNIDLATFISGYFGDLFTSDTRDPDQGLLSKVKHKVTPVMNETLLAPFSAEEVKRALFGIGDMKAPRLDGLHAIFINVFGQW